MPALPGHLPISADLSRPIFAKIQKSATKWDPKTISPQSENPQWSNSEPLPPVNANSPDPLVPDGKLSDAESLNLPQRIVEVPLKDERGSELTFHFKAPSWDNLAASANRLMKFEFPAIREVKVYERLIKTNVLSPGLSKKALEALPLPSLETIYRMLWQAWFGQSVTLADEWLCLFLLAEDLESFRLNELVQQDIEQLGLRDPGTMHSYYYQGPLNREQMTTFLTGHGYRAEFLNATDAEPAPIDPSLAFSYLACRKLSRPLPWHALLEKLTASDLERYPRLAYLQAVAADLQATPWMQTPITSESLLAQLTQLRAYLNTQRFARLSAGFGLARPPKTLVIVEGETENLLLPILAKTLHLNLEEQGIHLLPAGGKNHVLSIYRQQSRVLNCPIFIVLDQDAYAIADELRTNFRDSDAIFTIEEGEFEDTYNLKLVLQAINQNYQPYPEVTPGSFREMSLNIKAKGMVQTLKALWQAYNLGSFDKIEFALQYRELLQALKPEAAQKALHPTIRTLIESMLEVRQST